MNLISGITGHVGDGNFHAILIFDLQDAEEVARAKAYNKKIVEFAMVRVQVSTALVLANAQNGLSYKYKDRLFFKISVIIAEYIL